jgi:hypothetical protein
MEQSPIAAATIDPVIEALRSLSLSERLLALYGYGIEGCAQRNEEQVIAALEELMSSLNFDYGEIAEGFQRLYAFCIAKAREQRFEQVAWILRELHDIWAHDVSGSPEAAAVPLAAAAS